MILTQKMKMLDLGFIKIHFVHHKEDLNSYCGNRVICKKGYKASSCKQTIESPIKCVPSSGRRSKRKSRKNRKSSRR